MTKKAKKVRNYRATDSTMINVGASKKRDTVQNARIAALEKAFADYRRLMNKLAKDVAAMFELVNAAKRKAAKRR